MVDSSLVPSSKWNTEVRNVAVGDIVLLKKESKILSRYTLGKITKTEAGSDGKVRRVVVEYTNPAAGLNMKNTDRKETERNVHNVVVIVPVEEQFPSVP